MTKEGYRSVLVKEEAYEKIKQIAEKKDISICQAITLVISEFLKNTKKKLNKEMISMRSFPFRTNQKLFETIKQKAKEKNISINELINRAIEHFLNCRIKEKEEIKQASLKLIITKYNGTCSKCGNKIEIGSLAYYGRISQRELKAAFL